MHQIHPPRWGEWDFISLAVMGKSFIRHMVRLSVGVDFLVAGIIVRIVLLVLKPN